MFNCGGEISLRDDGTTARGAGADGALAGSNAHSNGNANGHAVAPEAFLIDLEIDRRGIRSALVRAESPAAPPPSQAIVLATSTAAGRVRNVISIPSRPLAWWRQFRWRVVLPLLGAGALGSTLSLAILEFRLRELDLENLASADAMQSWVTGVWRGRSVAATHEAGVARDEVESLRTATSALQSKLRSTADSAAALDRETALHRDAIALAGDDGSRDAAARLGSLIQRLPDISSDKGTALLILVGESQISRSRYAIAEACFREVLESRHPGESHRIEALAGLAMACQKQGKLRESEARYRELLLLERDHDDFARPTWLHVYGFADVCLRRGKYDDANDAVDRLLLKLEFDEDEDPKVIRDWRERLWDLADVAVEQRQYPLAMKLLEQVSTLGYVGRSRPEKSALEQRNAFPVEDLLTKLCARDGRLGDAKVLLQHALAKQRASAGNLHPSVANIASALADVDEKLGDLTEAETALKLVMQIREQTLGVNHPDVAATAHALARIYQRQGRQAEADALLKLASSIWNRTSGN